MGIAHGLVFVLPLVISDSKSFEAVVAEYYLQQLLPYFSFMREASFIKACELLPEENISLPRGLSLLLFTQKLVRP